MAAPRVSVIVPLYDGERFLAEALDSALAQTFRDLEIIVVDDGSRDGGGALADRYAQQHPEVVRVIHQHNQGLCCARNAALAAARGEYLALLDADDVWLPHHLADSVGRLDADPQLGLVHADIERIDGDGNSLGRSPRFWRDLDGDVFEALFVRREHACCPTAVFRRSVVERVGTFDERFNRLGCEDRDLWLRIAAIAGVAYLGDVHARYRLHGANMSTRFDRMLQARVMLVDKFAATTRGRKLRRRALAAAHCNLGDELMDAARRRDALGAYARACVLQPTEQKALRGLLRCLLSPRPPRAPAKA